MAIVDNRTDNLNMPLPHRDNPLSADVLRLRTSLAMADAAIAEAQDAASTAQSAASGKADSGDIAAAIASHNSDATAHGGAGGGSASPMTGATSSAAGTAGTVPAPAAGDQAKFLRGDATWQEPSTYTHPTTAGNKHIPAGGSSGKILGWQADGTAQWVDEPASSRHVTTIALSAKSLFIPKNMTTTVTVETDSDGTVTASTSNSAVATATVSGKVVTVTGAGAGTCTITITVAKTNTYYAQRASVSVKCVSASTTLESNDWATISAIGAAGLGDSFWDVGDKKSVALSGTVGTLALSGTYYVFIIDFNYRGDNGVYFQGFKTSGNVDIALCDSKIGSSGGNTGAKQFNMNHWGATSGNYNTNFGGWKGCDLRYDILGSVETPPSGYGATATTTREGYDATSAAKTSPKSGTLMAALPAALRSALSLWTVYTDNVGNKNAGQPTASVDYLVLLAEYEVHGARTYANANEASMQAQMAYYANGNSKIKYNHSATGAAVYWWCRSPYASYAYSFCYVGTSGSASNFYSYYSSGLAPAFRLAEAA